MKKTHKKLALNRQTLRRLTSGELGRPAAGRQNNWSLTGDCSSFGDNQCEALAGQLDSLYPTCPPPSAEPGCTE